MRKNIEEALGFLLEIRVAFYDCDVKPVFYVVKRGNTYLVKHVKKILISEKPCVEYTKISNRKLLSKKFQKLLSALLEAHPITLSGTNDLFFRLPSGRMAKIPRVNWSIDIFELKQMQRNLEGEIIIGDFSFRDQPLGIEVTYGD